MRAQWTVLNVKGGLNVIVANETLIQPNLLFVDQPDFCYGFTAEMKNRKLQFSITKQK